MAVGNTVSATIATSYGCFWISFAIILIPGFGIAEAYPTAAEFNHGLGFFMLVQLHNHRLVLNLG
jgi:succinate-acetate transporter protein